MGASRGEGNVASLKKNAKWESIASLTKKKSKHASIDDAEKKFIDHA